MTRDEIRELSLIKIYKYIKSSKCTRKEVSDFHEFCSDTIYHELAAKYPHRVLNTFRIR